MRNPKEKTDYMANTHDVFCNLTYEVSQAVKIEPTGEINELQNHLFNIHTLLSKRGSGKYILDFPNKLNLGLCFAFLLHYDWEHNSSLREVWAENGFYCIMDYLDNQPNGRQGQEVGMVALFVLLCVGRDSLNHEIQNIIDKDIIRMNIMGYPNFHSDDYKIGSKNVIDQISLLAVSGINADSDEKIQVLAKILTRYNGEDFFKYITNRKDLMKYNVDDVIKKARFIKKIIASILEDF